MEVTFRSVREEDEIFLFELYASTRAEEIALVPWNDEQRRYFLKSQFCAQSDHYRNKYPDASFQIIVVDGEPAGRLYVARLDSEVRIIDLTLMPSRRGLGIGVPIIRRIMGEAAEGGKPVTIYLDSFGRSRGLFERLGFSAIEDNRIHALMRWEPASTNARDPLMTSD